MLVTVPSAILVASIAAVAFISALTISSLRILAEVTASFAIVTTPALVIVISPDTTTSCATFPKSPK